jgi:hypothetical protein
VNAAMRSALLLVVITTFIALPPLAHTCSWANGYFFQVTCLRGKVVGVAKGNLRQMSRWVRQKVLRDDAGLTLYEYRWPVKDLSEMRVVKSVQTDKHGVFDFGTLPDGHYRLDIKGPWGEELFDVQVVQLPTRTASVTPDISPVYPDCTGGHELVAIPE